MKQALRYIFIFLFLTIYRPVADAIEVIGYTEQPVVIVPDISSGLESVIVLSRIDDNTRLLYPSETPSLVKWYRFSRLGGGFAEEIQSEATASDSRITPGSEDMGYIAEEQGRRTCVWVVNYSLHELSLGSVKISPESDCNTTLLQFDGSADEIAYYSINGRRLVLSRDLDLAYRTLTFDQESFSYTETVLETSLASAGSTINIPAPLCNTTFTLTGDRFLKVWNREQSIESPLFTTFSVEAVARATQEARDNDNEQKDGSDGDLGGSAPCDILFQAAVSDAAVFKEWQISRNSDFDILENQFSDLELEYTFRDNGTTYVRFVADNADGTCRYESDAFIINIGESRLEIPNAFSPGASPGVNDEWKVSYRSIVSFECHIFNRAGQQLFRTTDPAIGWDGKYRGKIVPAGVYFYVIKARGADGKKYDRAGDINIINYVQGTTGSGDNNQTTE